MIANSGRQTEPWMLPGEKEHLLLYCLFAVTVSTKHDRHRVFGFTFSKPVRRSPLTTRLAPVYQKEPGR
jgi:hypothetical protein